jgi:starch synthase (maltosyl-transferring)
VQDGRERVVIENVLPQVEEGRYPIKRVIGESVTVSADIFCDGHDEISAELLFRKSTEEQFSRKEMRFSVNDRWTGSFRCEEMVPYIYTVRGWVDQFKTWQVDLRKKFAAGQDIGPDLLDGGVLVEEAAQRAVGEARERLLSFSELLRTPESQESRYGQALDPTLTTLMAEHQDSSRATLFPRELKVWVDPVKGLFSAWYELFPRSVFSDPVQTDGTLLGLEKLLPEITRMGFDVVYLPPIHPIGTTNRKGRNNAPRSESGEPGSPWAIGSPDGGHKAVHPGLGTIEDFRHLVRAASLHGLDVALDIAFQCSPDHPWVFDHPEWFRHRADGSIRFAENPPKKYEDVYPINFECENWRELWEELLSVFLFWAGQGVRFFRVDNPHTKPMPFWEWCIAEVKSRHPETIFLSEAFTRPKVMYRLAKVGFSQSYTYFTWRNTKVELTDYMTELTRSAPRDYFRPNFWPNTPDILPEYLQFGGRPASMIRLVLAATLSASYGIYGPVFELIENQGLPGKEEYLDSEKYQIRTWEWNRPGNLREFIARINAIRRENPALQSTWNLRFLKAENDFILFYAKISEDGENVILVAVNLDPYHSQSAWVEVPVDEFGISSGSYLAHDLLGDDKFIWHGSRNMIELDPAVLPARIFRIRKKLRTETDFDYFM